MVLKAKTDAAATSANKFESMDDTSTATAVAEKPATVVADIPVQAAAEAAPATPAAEAAAPEAPAAEAEAAKTTAVVVQNAKAGAVAVTKKLTGALSEYENQFDSASIGFGTFPRVTVGLDGFSKDATTDLGKEIKIEVMSYNNRWVASPGTDDEEAKKHVRYSNDGKTIASTGDDNGMDIMEYIQEMKTVHGLSDAGLKEYLAIYGFLTFANGAEIDEADREIIELQVPPQSKARFQRHQITEGVKIARNVSSATPFVTCTQEKIVNGAKKYALINFSK